MSDSENERITFDSNADKKNAGPSKILGVCAMYVPCVTQSPSDSKQTNFNTQEIGDIVIETHDRHNAEQPEGMTIISVKINDGNKRRRERQQRYRKRHREVIRERNRNYYQRHKIAQPIASSSGLNDIEAMPDDEVLNNQEDNRQKLRRERNQRYREKIRETTKQRDTDYRQRQIDIQQGSEVPNTDADEASNSSPREALDIPTHSNYVRDKFEDAPSKRRCLKKSAIPSCNVPEEQMTVDKRSIIKSHHKKVHRPNEWDGEDQEAAEIAYVNVKSFEATTAIDVEQLHPSLVNTIGTTTMQQSSGFTLRSCIKTNQQLRSLTGIEDFHILNRIVNIVHSANPEISNSKSNLELNITMTFVKLKQNSSFKSLAILCRIRSAQKCEKIFNKMLEVLSECLKSAIYWPTKTEISCNMPKSFKGFEGVRVVLDCTEIKIEKSKNISYKVQTYSPYKNDYTIKFVTGFTPSGVVSFISEPYGGKMSYKATFANCNLIKKLDRHDFMMIDRRFVANDVCKDRETKFVARISYVKGQKQLPTCYALITSKDPKISERMERNTTYALMTSKDPKMGEHIESQNRRIKSFKILNERFPAKLIEKSRDILTIICATVNMSSLILKDYKFEL